MRIIKNFDAGQSEGAFLSDCVDKSLKAVEHLIIESIEIRLGIYDKTEFMDGRCRLTISKENVFLTDSDAFGMRAFLIRALYRMEESRMGLGDFIHDILAGRKMVRTGLEEYIFHYYYVWVGTHNRKIKTLREFLLLNASWLTFSHGKQSADFFRKMMGLFEYDKSYEKACERLFSLAQGELYTEARINEVFDEYKNISDAIRVEEPE